MLGNKLVLKRSGSFSCVASRGLDCLARAGTDRESSIEDAGWGQKGLKTQD